MRLVFGHAGMILLDLRLLEPADDDPQSYVESSSTTDLAPDDEGEPVFGFRA